MPEMRLWSKLLKSIWFSKNCVSILEEVSFCIRIISFYDKCDDFNFHITNFPFLSCNIISSPAYGVFISQLIRYARTCSSYECFILRAVRLSNKLLGQGNVKESLRSSREVLWSVRGSYQTIWGPPLPNVTRHSGWWPSTVIPSIDQALHQFLTLLLIQTFYRIWLFAKLREVSIEYLQRVRHANRGRLLIRTPGPVPLCDLKVF